MGKVKEDVSHLLKAGFMQPCRYAEWVPNVVPVEKKGTEKIRVCINFGDLNRANPKDEYPMLVADLLINSASGNRLSVSWMATRGITRFSWPRRTSTRLPFNVQAL
jgi:hypothetical protein